jgi:phosphoribosylamine--glycine ligase
MRVLVVGGGGREHALCWAIAASPLLTKLWCAPGNPGIAEVAECVPIGATDIAALVRFAREKALDLVVAGPEAPLTLGLADACAAAGIRCFGPSAAAARLEGSKAFCREVCDAAGVPGAAWARFDDAAAARAHVRAKGAPIVVKADGLAAGKGVVVAQSVAEAEAAIADIMESRVHGAAGATVVIEECLLGDEISFFALCDGTRALPLGAAQDHKRVGEGDTGPNTGGMGAYSPPPAFGDTLRDAVMARIVQPTLAEMAKRGTPFRGVLFAGLMLTSEGPKLIEFNVRFGDPECQALLLRLRSDLLPALLAACDGNVTGADLRWSDESSLVVVMAAEGYPGAPRKGTEIRGLDRAAAVPGAHVFHAGTARRADGALVADGGRVLAIGATGGMLRAARDAAYAAVDVVDWPGGFCRRDIGWRALRDHAA